MGVEAGTNFAASTASSKLNIGIGSDKTGAGKSKDHTEQVKIRYRTIGYRQIKLASRVARISCKSE